MLCRPVLFTAHIVLCVYPPEPETSSRFWCGWPHWILRLLRRDSGATYASIPMIGVIPAFFAEWKKSYAPWRLPWSDMAMCVMPISLHALNMSFSRAAPSSREYWVWTCRCVKGGFDTVWAPKANGRRRDGDDLEVYDREVTADGHSGVRSGVGRDRTPVPRCHTSPR